MGTTYTIKIVGENISKKTINKKLQQINNIFSTWITNSELSKINQAPTNHWLEVSDELLFVLKTAQIVHKQSYGYFDITMAGLSQKWGFQQKDSKVYDFGQKYLIIKNKKIKKLKNIKLDVSAIAKGYGVDEIVRLLKNKNFKNFLVEIGGEVRSVGYKSKNIPWAIAIEIPNKNPKKITLTNKAIATSGNYRNYYIKNNKKYSHIINPKTTNPITNNIISVSVLHSSTMFADAYATAIMAMPLEKGKGFIKKLNLKTIIITNNP